MKFLRWLEKESNENFAEIKESKAVGKRKKKTVLKQTIKEIEKGTIEVTEPTPVVIKEKFIDEVTGKEYKTAATLKAAITRRKRKKTIKPTTKGTKKQLRIKVVSTKSKKISQEVIAEAFGAKLIGKVDRTGAEEKFIDIATKKEYKTASALKAAITRRNNKAKEATKVKVKDDK